MLDDMGTEPGEPHRPDGGGHPAVIRSAVTVNIRVMKGDSAAAAVELFRGSLTLRNHPADIVYQRSMAF